MLLNTHDLAQTAELSLLKSQAHRGCANVNIVDSLYVEITSSICHKHSHTLKARTSHQLTKAVARTVNMSSFECLQHLAYKLQRGLVSLLARCFWLTALIICRHHNHMLSCGSGQTAARRMGVSYRTVRPCSRYALCHYAPHQPLFACRCN